MHSDFTLFLRKYPNGKEVYFYYTYDGEDRRRGPWTTKSQNKTAARNYCHKLIKAGALIPDRRKSMSFGEFADGFWNRGSIYLSHLERRREMADTYVSTCKSITENQLAPYFGTMPLDKMTLAEINKWLLDFTKREVIADGKKTVKEYKNSFANTALRILKVMMKEAVRRELIAENPCAKVEALRNEKKNIEIVSIEEVQKLFPENYQAVWGRKEKNEVVYIANRLASLTGMRIGEIRGLRGEYVFDDYIQVCGQYGQFGYKAQTKTKANRNIPIMPDMVKLLQKLMEKNGKGFLFSLNGGGKPVTTHFIASGLYSAFGKIGIGKAEVKRRGLTPHNWRHFLNTELQRQGLTIQQVQSVTGHKSDRMSEWYTHLDARQIGDVVKAQSVIAGIDKPKDDNTVLNEQTGNNKLKLVKTENLDRKLA